MFPPLLLIVIMPKLYKKKDLYTFNPLGFGHVIMQLRLPIVSELVLYENGRRADNGWANGVYR